MDAAWSFIVLTAEGSGDWVPYSALQSGWIMGPIREFWVPHFGHIVGVLLEVTCERLPLKDRFRPKVSPNGAGQKLRRRRDEIPAGNRRKG
jgi:hypothetical protein